MDVLLALILVLVLLAAAVYVQYRLPAFTSSNGRAWLVRLVLIGVGVLGGMVSAARYGQAGEVLSVLAFLGAFGVVHVPAAFILFLKQQQRRENP